MSMRRRRLVVSILAVVTVLAVGGGAYWLLANRHTSPLPREIVAQANFPVYFPSPVPTGYALKADSAGGDSDTVYYTLRSATNGHTITVTMQAIPSGFDAAKIIGSSPIPTTITPTGTLYNLSIGGSTKYMLVSDETLFFITSAKAIATKDINAIANNFARI